MLKLNVRSLTLAAVLIGSFCVPANASVDGPYAMHAALGFGTISGVPKSIPRYAKLEVDLPFRADYPNPFDSGVVTVDASITTPHGAHIKVPAFFMVDAVRALNGATEHITLAKTGEWKLRYSPSETGDYHVVLTGTDHTGSVSSRPFAFHCNPSRGHGFIHVSKLDRFHFAFDDGAPYFAIGANVCWAGSRGTYDFDDWFPKYAANGANYARLWLSPLWMTFALEQPGSAAAGKGLGSFDMANAWRLDYVLNMAQRDGLYLMLCTESYNVLREKDGFPEWENSPQNAKNGGPLNRPDDFWTNPEMARLYKNKLRYLVARYGYSTHVMSWEFWNEVDGTTDYDPAKVTEWHRVMSATLKALDPYHHLRTTSFGNSPGLPATDRLADLDYSQTHSYGSPDLVLPVIREWKAKRAYGKPHYVGENGESSAGPDTNLDPEGLQIHDPAWAAVGGAQAGTAMVWWWDSLIAPKNLYHIYRPIADFTRTIDWGAERMHPIPSTSRVLKPNGQHGDIDIQGGPISWSPAPFNKPVRVDVSENGIRSNIEVAGLMHGLSNHKDLHNPATFHYSVPWASTFTVTVTDVSAFGGAAIAISLDGRVAVTKAFPDNHNDGVNPHKNAETFTVAVPPGNHTVFVEDTGADWFYLSYRLLGVLRGPGAPLLTVASTGKHTTILWARVIGRTVGRVNLAKETIPPAPASVVTLSNVAPGPWSGILFDTWTGRVIGNISGRANSRGILSIHLGPVAKNVAVKLKHG